MRKPISAISISLLFCLTAIGWGETSANNQSLLGENQVQEGLTARAKQRRPAVPHRGSGRRTVALSDQAVAMT